MNGQSQISERLRPISIADLASSPPRKYVVKGLIGEGELSVWYGEPKCGKSFLLFEAALAVARGIPWLGRKVRQGLVIYIAAEGIGGIPKRIAAYFKYHGLDTGDIPLYLILGIVDLLDPATDTDAVIKEIKKTEAATVQNCILIIIDTLSRTMPGGNENSPEDMSQYIRNCDRLRHETGAHVAIIHHKPKGNNNTPRGHSSLFGAVDALILVEKTDSGNSATVEACKDDADGFQIGFGLEVVELGFDEDGDPITSCVVVPADVPVRTGRKCLSPTAQLGMTALCAAMDKVGEYVNGNPNIPKGARCVRNDAWRAEFYAMKGGEPEANKKAYQRLTTSLQNAGRVGIYSENVWIIDSDGTSGT